MNIKKYLPIELNTVVIDCKDISMLSDFYIRMLGWEKSYDDGIDWIDIISPSGGTKIGFQQNLIYTPPVWPEEENQQQQMLHLDFTVRNLKELELVVAHAVSCGAVLAEQQYSHKWTVLLDPEGHPFCFVIY